MSIRIPILEQQSRAEFIPQGSVAAVQVADPRGEALQGLGRSLGEFGSALNERKKKQDPGPIPNPPPETQDPPEGPDPDAEGYAPVPPPYTRSGWRTVQNNKLATVLAAADQSRRTQAMGDALVARQGPGAGEAGAGPNVTAGAGAGAGVGDGSASANAAAVNAYAPAVNLLGPLGPLLGVGNGANPAGGVGGAGAWGGAGASAGAGTAGDAGNAQPPYATPATHGLTGAYLHNYDLISREAIAGIPDPTGAANAATLFGRSRAKDGPAMLQVEAQQNLARRQASFTGAVQTLAERGARDPASLPDLLAFVDTHMIDVGQGQQAAYKARMRATLLAPAVDALIARDPQAMVAALGGEASSAAADDAAGNSSAASNTATVDPAVNDPLARLADHPVVQLLTPQERAAYLPQARAAASIAQSNERAAARQDVATALQSYRDTGSASHPPSLADLTRVFGQEEGTQQFQRLLEAQSEGRQVQIFRALPSAELELARVDPQADAATQRAITRVMQARQADSVAAGIASGGYGLRPADLSSPQAALASAGVRVPASAELAQGYNTPRVLFSHPEFTQLARLAEGMPPEKLEPWLKQLTATIGEPALVRSTLLRLSAESKVIGLAALMQYEEEPSRAGGSGADLMQGEDAVTVRATIAPVLGGDGRISAPRQMLNGYALLHPPGDASGEPGAPAVPMPAESELRGPYVVQVGDRYADQPGAQEAHYEAARAIYASLSEQAGDASGKLDAVRWSAAVHLAIHGSGTAREVGLEGPGGELPQAQGNGQADPGLSGPNATPVQTSGLASTDTPVGRQLRTDLDASMQGSASMGAEGSGEERLSGAGIQPLDTARTGNEAERDVLLAQNGEGTASEVGGASTGTADTTGIATQNQGELNRPPQGAVTQPRDGALAATAATSGETEPLKPRPWEKDPPGEFINRAKRSIENPPPGTSNTAASELPKRYPADFKKLRDMGKGRTIFGSEQADRWSGNNFSIPRLPEESLNDPTDPTYHKYGVLTYIGPVDASKGITKETLLNLLVGRYSRPGPELRPVPPDFSGLTDAYATPVFLAMKDEKNLEKPENYIYRIGSIAQAKVPDGVVNITETDHGVYPGTIRRMVMEVDGHLYVFTQGSGVNRFENSPLVDESTAVPIVGPVMAGGKAARRGMATYGNDVYGPLAFKQLDHQLYEDVERVRKGEPLAPVDTRRNPVETLPPAIFYKNPRRGTR